MQENIPVETRVYLLEHTMVAQQEAIRTTQEDIKRVLLEIHDKLDNHILAQAILNTRIEANLDQTKTKLAETETKFNDLDKKYLKVIMGVITLFTTALGGAYQLLKP